MSRLLTSSMVLVLLAHLLLDSLGQHDHCDEYGLGAAGKLGSHARHVHLALHDHGASDHRNCHHGHHPTPPGEQQDDGGHRPCHGGGMTYLRAEQVVCPQLDIPTWQAPAMLASTSAWSFDSLSTEAGRSASGPPGGAARLHARLELWLL